MTKVKKKPGKSFTNKNKNDHKDWRKTKRTKRRGGGLTRVFPNDIAKLDEDFYRSLQVDM